MKNKILAAVCIFLIPGTMQAFELERLSSADVAASMPAPKNLPLLKDSVKNNRAGSTDQYYTLLNPVGSDYVTVDNRTELMWITNQDDIGIGKGARTSWRTAKQTCTLLKYAGYSDWRLPEREELLSIGETNMPGINHKFFPNTYQDYYWTSTPGADINYSGEGLDYKWAVNFTHTPQVELVKISTIIASVRCVRDNN